MAANSSELQRKIFSRYVNQKLALTRAITVDDVVEQGKTGVVLFNLIEVLSEVNFTEKYNQAPKLRVHSLDNCNRALKFAKDQGVVMKVFPQAENLVDGDEKAVLGLIWSIILKFMKFGDADESLNAKDALLMWVQNKTAGYEGVDVKDFKASIKDGVALGAVIHKHRPAMIDMSTLTPGAANAVANWKIVQDAAERYFGLEKYITPEDILKLDENSMVIYVSEYYYGIAEQRKVDLAARRIHKLVEFTKQNDELRARFAASAQSFLTRVAKVRETLNDRTIDNTLAGARAKIAQFYEYKEQDKASILADQLNLEALYNSLSMRLAHHKRPAFVPPAGTSLADMNATLNELEKTEQERNIALHAELNRQLRLVDINAQHVTASQHLEAYQAGARQALEVKEVSQSVAEASYQIRRLDAAEAAQANIEETNWADLQKLGSFLVAEKYEHSADVLARQSALSDGFAQLSSLAAAKRPVLLDDLAREEFREELRIEGLMHRRAADVLLAWADNSDAYLQTREHIDDIPKAKTQIGLLAAWRKDKDSQPVPALNNLGAKIRAAQYNGQYSSYTYGTAPTDSDHVADLDSREQNVAARWQQMDHFAQEKATWLEAELARETEKEALRVQFATQAADFIRLIEGKSLQFNNEHFGFTLAEVEGYQSTLQQAEEAFTQQVAAAVAVYTDTFERAQGLGVTSNIYTSESPSSLAAVQSKGQAALQARNQRYQETLARQRYLDGLCRDFAALVDPFGQALVAAKDRISASEGELEEQLQFVLSKIEQSTGADLQQLASIQAAQDKLDAEGVTNNIHTSLSAKDVHSQHRQYGAFLNAKKAMLEEMIEHKRLRGLTPDQFKEIEDNFNQFDADRDSNLNARELKTCLYSLGEEKRPKEIADIVEKWGKGGLIDYAGFREFMIQLLGDSDTKEEITNGFKLIARGHDSVIETAKMELVMDPSDIAFIISTTPQLDAGYDYPNWIEQVFSR